MNHTKPNFKALRELVGISQQTLANIVGVDVRSVKRWEAPNNAWMAPEDAWAMLEQLRETQRQQVEFAMDKIDEIADAAGGEPDAVKLTYWLSESEFEQAHPGEGWGWQMANATARLIASHAESWGIPVEFDY